MEFEQLSEAADPTVAAEVARKEAAYEEQQFVNKFNDLAQTMMDFASHYNSRHKIDVKGVEKLRRALRDLEKSDGWLGLNTIAAAIGLGHLTEHPKSTSSRVRFPRAQRLCDSTGETIAFALVRRNAENAPQR